MWCFLLLLLVKCSSFNYSKTADLKELTVWGLSDEIFTQKDYRSSGTYTQYEKVILGYGITRLGDSVFSQSSNLKTVEFPTTLKSFGSSLFYQTDSLESITLPEGLTSIPLYTFRESLIQTLSIPSSVTYIAGDATFSNRLKKIIFPNGNPIYSTNEEGSILIINRTYLFQACGGCQNITVPPYIETIGLRFSCWRITSGIIFSPNSNLRTVQSGAFDFSSISRVEFPEGLTLIEGPCFAESGVTFVSLPSSLVFAPNDLFYHASKLREVDGKNSSAVSADPSGIIMNFNKTAVIFMPTSIEFFHIPWTLESFDATSMKANPGFERITADSNHSIYYAEDNILYKRRSENKFELKMIGPAGSKTDIKIHKNCTELEVYLLKGTSAEYVSFLGDKVTEIPQHCFENAIKLKEVVLADSIREVMYQSFCQCSLSKITFNPTIKIIHSESFSGSYLKKVDLSCCTLLTNIYEKCFSGCKYLTEVKLPPNLSCIYQYTFANCALLDAISIDTLRITRIENNAFEKCKLTRLEFTDTSNLSGLKSLGIRCFMGCGFEMVRIPDSVVSIEDECFSACPNLVEIEFGEGTGLELIPGRMIAGSNRMKELFVGAKVRMIEEGGIAESYGLMHVKVSEENTKFRGSEGMIISKDGEEIWCFAGGREKVKIVGSVRRIRNSAFLNCINLKEIEIDGGSKLREIGSSTFYGCSSIERIEFPGGLEVVGSKSFSGCKKLKEIEFAENSTLNRIEELAFLECLSLEFVGIPRVVEIIEEGAFKDCVNLKGVTLCVEEEKSGFSKDAFRGCKNLKSIGVSNVFRGTEVLGIPAQKILDGDCKYPSIKFTKKNEESSLTVIFIGNLLEHSIDSSKNIPSDANLIDNK